MYNNIANGVLITIDMFMRRTFYEYWRRYFPNCPFDDGSVTNEPEVPSPDDPLPWLKQIFSWEQILGVVQSCKEHAAYYQDGRARQFCQALLHI